MLASYSLLAVRREPFITSAFWLGLPAQTVYAILALQLLGAVLNCAPLWVAAAACSAMVAAAFEARSLPIPVLASIALATVVVLVDAVGWAALRIHTAAYRPDLR